MKTTLSLAMIFSVALTGCATTSVTVSARRDNTDVPQSKQIHRDNPLDIIQLFELTYREPDSTYSCVNTISKVVSHIMQHEINEATNLLRTICSSHDSPCQPVLKQLLNVVLIDQGDWDRILEMNASTLLEDETIKIARAFHRAPPQQLTFYLHEDTVLVHRGYFGLPFIDVVINGTPQRFLLDTGASETILSSDIAKECSVSPIDSSLIRGRSTTRDSLAAYPTIIHSMSIGRLTVKNHSAFILDSDALSMKLLGIFPLFKIDGIIGWRLLKQIDFTLDYNNRTLTLREPRRTKITNRNLFSLGKPYIMTATDTGQPLLFFWDSGAQSSSLTQTGVEKLSHARTDITINSQWGAGGSTMQVLPIVKELTIVMCNSDLSFSNLKAIPNRDRPLRYDGIFGNDIATKGVIKADLTNGLFYYSPSRE